ncbi:MAG: hypothetical protein ACD_65C00310G0002 [uncultured bacterium]|nr:MAG: hypothetical protein ACD_65C00310G0002 [uncultured bacterium]
MSDFLLGGCHFLKLLAFNSQNLCKIKILEKHKPFLQSIEISFESFKFYQSLRITSQNIGSDRFQLCFKKSFHINAKTC